MVIAGPTDVGKTTVEIQLMKESISTLLRRCESLFIDDYRCIHTLRLLLHKYLEIRIARFC
ncbi:hypothetical protein [Microcoleus sp. CAWBG58]|uniref:hypothetical protein n=1 Tax=Microcoleus sp. CAWBG58 TaxID=2841651 RepID=UPI0025E023E4|nr:hypothetical protein [Microcoleus sp. CAWBG58]